MKAYLIDVENEEVSLVRLPDGSEKQRERMKEMYRLLKCDTFTVGIILDNEDAIFVDDEGLLKLTEESKFFFYEGAHQPFAGNGLIIGADDEGEARDVQASLTHIKKNITFMTLDDARNFVPKKSNPRIVKMDDEDLKEDIQNLYASDWGIKDISKKLNVSYVRVKTIMDILGIKPRTKKKK